MLSILYDFLQLFTLRTISANVTMMQLTVVKSSFHYPSSRAELTARELGCIF